MYLEIITPEKKVFEGEVSEASFPGAAGAFQVLKGHAPLVSALANGLVGFSTAQGKSQFMIDGGVVEVLNDKIIVLAEKVLS
ncbi:ATP synthase F1 subunit epsilon [Penaeicola halotolerans]|uniref:ATP synthase F1 subunit epsilon n=1 Tax=Penaeicola halotolerans TaxID=2793196 RepID=UPI001CF8A5D5|nr:ATP synthase F1 subunit epsilon [Penaeicola halotolerans]